ncbi:MAG: hypothetical protein EOP33_08555 [Rickettsiaceae bacterium]|nr:MAG: hypothetical protein EOP33_08555 [Rickettsiaceae bacterium]
MYTIYLQHQNYPNPGPEISMPILPTLNDWIEIPIDIRQSLWPTCKDTLYVAEREYVLDESMRFIGVRLYLQDWDSD